MAYNFSTPPIPICPRRKGTALHAIDHLLQRLLLFVVFAMLSQMSRMGWDEWQGVLRRQLAENRRRICVHNIKTIEGANELYLMEKAVASNTVVDIPKLLITGYLKHSPQCPSGGHYTIMVRAAAGGGGGSGATVINCSVHQRIDPTSICL